MTTSEEKKHDYISIAQLQEKASRQLTNFQPINVEVLQATWKTLTPKVLQRMERSYLSTLRNNLRLELYSTRGEVIDLKTLSRLPLCPVCHSSIREADMHEALITRGHVDYAPFEKRVQIFVAQNCVLVHPGDCHTKAQYYEDAKQECIKSLLYWNGYDSIKAWLDYLQNIGLTEAFSAERRLTTWISLSL